MTKPPARTASRLSDALTVIGDRWALALVAALLDGPRRYGELQEALGTIAPNVLARRLRDLEAADILLARPYSTRPARYEYELTEAGADLAGPVHLLAAWAARQSGEDSATPRHGRCGTPLQTRSWCPACEALIDDEPTDPEDELLLV
jgi:DNA-binding HxlR family transcriptional regulator